MVGTFHVQAKSQLRLTLNTLQDHCAKIILLEIDVIAGVQMRRRALERSSQGSITKSVRRVTELFTGGSPPMKKHRRKSLGL